MNDKYKDIINLPHHISIKHKPMPIEERASQFAPFSALKGYEEAIKEITRLTSSRKVIDEDLKADINNKLNIIQENLKTKPKVSIIYFKHDNKKEGGEYIKSTGIIKNINILKRYILMTNNIKINMNDIIGIYGEIFKE